MKEPNGLKGFWRSGICQEAMDNNGCLLEILKRLEGGLIPREYHQTKKEWNLHNILL